MKLEHAEPVCAARADPGLGIMWTSISDILDVSSPAHFTQMFLQAYGNQLFGRADKRAELEHSARIAFLDFLVQYRTRGNSRKDTPSYVKHDHNSAANSFSGFRGLLS
jgi:hypothetical protein